MEFSEPGHEPALKESEHSNALPMSQSRGDQSRTETLAQGVRETVVNEHIVLRLRRPDLPAALRSALERIRTEFEREWAERLSNPALQQIIASAEDPTKFCEAIAFDTLTDVGQRIMAEIRSTMTAEDLKICDDICGEWKDENETSKPGPSSGPSSAGNGQ